MIMNIANSLNRNSVENELRVEDIINDKQKESLNKTKSSKPKEEFEKFLNVFSGYWSKKDYLSNK